MTKPNNPNSGPDNTNEKPPSKNLLVTVSYDPAAQNYEDFLMGTAIEWYGIYFELKKIDDHKISMVFMFEKVKNGEEFFDVMSQTKLEVEKEEL